MAAFCLICYKQILHFEERIDNFSTNQDGFKLLQKFYKVLHGVFLNLEFANAHKINVCELCFTVLSKYCDLHLDLECIQLKIQFQMETLKSVMYQAARVTKRVDQFRQDLFQDMEEAERQSNLENVFNLRENIYKKCKVITKSNKKLLVSMEVNPSIKVEDYQQGKPLPFKIESLVNSATSDNAVNLTDEEINDDITANLKMEQPSFATTNCEIVQGTPDYDSNPSSEDSASSHEWDCDNSEIGQSSVETNSSHESEKEKECKPKATILPVPCSVRDCEKRFQEEIHLQLHVKLHGNFLCNFCSYTCNLADQLLKHEWIEHSDKSNLRSGKTVKCSRCTRAFNSCRNARGAAHFYRDHLNIDYWNGECSECGSKLQVQKGSLEKAQKNHFKLSRCTASTNDKFSCTYKDCHQSFKIQNQLTMHLKMHGQFSCKFCSYTTNLADKLLDHEWQTHTIEVDGLAKCSRCPKTFDAAKSPMNEAHRKKHFFIEHLDLQYQQGKCHICGQTFSANSYSFKQSLKMHMKQHDIDKSEAVFCDICNAPFESWRRIMYHKLKVHKSSCFDCTVCKKACKSAHLLNEHITSNHKSFDLRKAKKFQCDFTNCGAKFLHQVTCEMHKERHKGPMLQCDICSKWSIDKAALETHMRKHKNAVENRKINVNKRCSVVCDLCGKICYAKWKAAAEKKLLLHKSSKLHDGVWEHSCEMCGKQCQNPFKLEEHIRIHTREKPFLCNVCGKEFSVKYNLKRHVKLVHANKKSNDRNENDDK